MHKLLSRLRRTEEGQAIVVAAVGLLIMVMGVLATPQIGHAVYEKIRLQNNADAAAYSLATVEAKTFNFFAYANRAMIGHYVSMMVWASWLSFLSFMEDLLNQLDKCILRCSRWW